MSELELALVSLGRQLDYPETPDLSGAVRRRLAEGERPRSWRRPLVMALAVLAVVVAAVMAVPQARSTILDWLGIGSVTVRQVEELPKIEGSDLRLGRRVSLAEARRLATFAVRVPTLSGYRHPAVYFRRDVTQVSLLYGSIKEPKLLISEIWAPGAIDKLVTTRTDVELVREGEWRGAWLHGGEHVLYLPGFDRELRLVGNALVVQGSDGVTVRIEADVSKQEAIRILRSLKKGE
ncbi:MAG TPA: hypothetical protein VGU26_03165 [Gaiellaceae bacterium]|nr:hypothetical protein [Gaiellaceae bacterium]